mgnify:CR=1 FL=1
MQDSILIIQARLNSTRLPRKILTEIPQSDGLTLLEFMYSRITEHIKIPVVFAIPNAKSDDELATFLSKKGIEFYRGPEEDLISRFIIGAEMYSAETIVRLTSDCPLVDPFLIEKMLNYFKSKKIDYLGNTTPLDKSTFPDGSDIEIFTKYALRKAHYQETEKRNREHVTFQFWEGNHDYSFENFQQEESFSHLRYTIDNVEDVLVFNRIYNDLIKQSLEFIGFAEIQNFLDKNSNITQINEKYNPGDNW